MKPKIYTTFGRLHDAHACTERYRHLARELGGITEYGRNTPITIQQIIEHNGLSDALWAVPTVEKTDDTERVFRLFACECAERVLPLFERLVSGDTRPRDCITAARRFAAGEIGGGELAAARAAARAAAWDAAGAAWDAGDAAWDAAWDAARAAAWAAAWAAARDAADAAGAAWAAGDAAWDAERGAQSGLLRKILDDHEALK